MPEEKEELSKGKGLFDVKLFIVAIAIIILAAGITFFVAKMVVSPLNGDNDQNIVSKSMGPVYELDEIIVNLADSGGRRFLKTQITFGVNKNNVSKEMNDKIPQIRDRVILILSEKNISDIETATGKEMLKQEIIDNINPLLATGEIEEVYFITFTYQ